ncbi:hypothetical protein BC831DRAFT_378084, partial [Entophlyctis helioformis]
LQRYHRAFIVDKTKIGTTHLVKATIDVQGHPPIAALNQRHNPVRRAQVIELTEDMKRRDVIEESTSPWASPIVLVRKSDGKI